MELPQAVTIIASLVALATALVNFKTAADAYRPRLQVELRGHGGRMFDISVTNLGRHGQVVKKCGLLAGKRDLPTNLSEDETLPQSVDVNDFTSFTVRLAEPKPAARVTGAWVTTADGHRFESRPERPIQPPVPPVYLSARARARLNTSIFAVAIYALIWSIHPSAPCITVTIASSNEKFSLMDFIAKDFNARPTPALFGLGRCEDVQVYRLESGVVEASLASGWDRDEDRPDVWSPASTSWAKLLSHDLIVAGKLNYVPENPPKLAQSQLVVGMPEPKVRALGWLDKVRDKAWKEIFDLARDPSVWTAYDTSWNGFRVQKTNPNVSTSGMHTLIAQYVMATGRLSPTCESVASVQAEVRQMERASVKYGAFDTIRKILDDLYDVDQLDTILSFASAIPMEEAQLWQYNRGNPQFRWSRPGLDPRQHPRPNVKLVALYPTVTLVADHPFVILTSPSDEKTAVASRFLRYLLEPRQQAFFREAGFRDELGALGDGIGTEDGLDRGGARAAIDAPNGDAIRCMLVSWSKVRAGAPLHTPAWNG